LDSIPPKVVKSGSQTVSQLIKRFSVVRKAAHVASLVPEKSPTVLGHGFAHVFSFFYFEPPAQLIEGAVVCCSKYRLIQHHTNFRPLQETTSTLYLPVLPICLKNGGIWMLQSKNSDK
jgi:hypothetical protein